MFNASWPPKPEINKAAWEVVLIELGPQYTINLSQASGGTLTRQPPAESLLIRQLRKSGREEELASALEEQRQAREKEMADKVAMLREGASLYREIAALPDKSIQARLEGHHAAARSERLQHFKARFDFWARMDGWTIDEGLYLAFGIDPDSLEKIIPLHLIQDWETHEVGKKSLALFSPLYVLPPAELEEYEQARAIALRKFGFKNQQGTISMGAERYPPKEILNWFAEKEILLHAELVEALEARGIFIDSLQKLTGKLTATDKLVDKLTREKKNLTEHIVDLESQLKSRPEKEIEKEVVGKSRKYFLILVNALAGEVIGGRTGQPYKDGEAVGVAMTDLPIPGKSLGQLLGEYDKNYSDE